MNGHQLLGQLPRVGVQPLAIVRALDDQGTFAAASMRIGPDGNPQAVIHRDDYLDAEQLLEAIRQVVREELQRVFGHDDDAATRWQLRPEIQAALDNR